VKKSNAVRLQSFLARAGLASRRGSEELIRTGRVLVNGKLAEIGQSVTPEDVVQVDGRVVRVQRIEWVALHKPKGYVTTRDDERGRKTVYELLPAELHHLFHVGRLDRNSSGILLLTNDGEGANRLLHPRYETTKEYLVDVDGEPDSEELRKLVKGVQLEDGVAHAESAELQDEVKEGVFRLRVVMQEGRNREVRRMMEALGFQVLRLFRRRFASIEVGKLRPGEWRRLTAAEIQRLRGPGAAPAAPAPSRAPRPPRAEGPRSGGPRPGPRAPGRPGSRDDSGRGPRGGSGGGSRSGAPRGGGGGGRRGPGGKPRRPS
jgi:23S rRNA pseudouridine2605 synthase